MRKDNTTYKITLLSMIFVALILGIYGLHQIDFPEREEKPERRLHEVAVKKKIKEDRDNKNRIIFEKNGQEILLKVDQSTFDSLRVGTVLSFEYNKFFWVKRRTVQFHEFDHVKGEEE